jgi:hypothetical protein
MKVLTPIKEGSRIIVARFLRKPDIAAVRHEGAALYRSVIFNLGYPYPRGYAKTF